jgi:hypothetical protein
MKNEEYIPHPDPLHVGTEGDIASAHTSEYIQKEAHLIRGVGELKNNDMYSTVSSRTLPEISGYTNVHTEENIHNEE